MIKTSTLAIATLFTALAVTLLSTTWIVFVPFIFHSEEMSSALNQVVFFVFWAISVTSVIVLILGVPVYLMLYKYNKASLTSLGAVGFIIPIIIILVLDFWLSSSNGSYSSGQNYHGTFREMVVENERTFWGWVSFTEQVITFGLYGLLGAIVFGKTVSSLEQSQK